MQKKLKIADLKVESFITELNEDKVRTVIGAGTSKLGNCGGEPSEDCRTAEEECYTIYPHTGCTTGNNSLNNLGCGSQNTGQTTSGSGPSTFSGNTGG